MKNKINYSSADDAAETMIDARQASYALHLPYYWFADPQMRKAKKIPHYQLSRLVRFRVSELLEWQRRNDKGRSQPTESTGGDA